MGVQNFPEGVQTSLRGVRTTPAPPSAAGSGYVCLVDYCPQHVIVTNAEGSLNPMPKEQSI